MSSGRENNTPSEKTSRWQKAVDYLLIAAEISNAGIAFQTAGQWVPAIAAFFAIGPLAYLILVPEALIYFFRAVAALTKIIGREFFGVKFREEKIKSHPYQTLGDLVCLACFTLAVMFFVGGIVAPPLGITLAWLMGLAGIACNSYFNYLWPEIQLKKKFENIVDDPSATEDMQIEAYRQYKQQKISRRWYMGVVVGVAVLVLCGSTAALAAPLVATILTVISNTASVFLIGVAFVRLRNWFLSRKDNKEKAAQAVKDPVPSAPVEEKVVDLESKNDLKPRPRFFSAPALDRPKLAKLVSERRSSAPGKEIEMTALEPQEKKLTLSPRHGLFSPQAIVDRKVLAAECASSTPACRQ